MKHIPRCLVNYGNIGAVPAVTPAVLHIDDEIQWLGPIRAATIAHCGLATSHRELRSRGQQQRDEGISTHRLRMKTRRRQEVQSRTLRTGAWGQRPPGKARR